MIIYGMLEIDIFLSACEGLIVADWEICKSSTFTAKTFQVSHFLFSPRGGFLCGNCAPLFFTRFGYVVLPWVGSANLGHRCLHSSRPTDFNKRSEISSIAYWRISQSWIVLPHIFLNNRTSPEKPVERPLLTTQGSMETARSAAGRRKAR
jgi:hypothetical protein